MSRKFGQGYFKFPKSVNVFGITSARGVEEVLFNDGKLHSDVLENRRVELHQEMCKDFDGGTEPEIDAYQKCVQPLPFQ